MSADVFDPIETAPWPDVLRLNEAGLQRQLDYLYARSAFYRRKLAGTPRESLRSSRDLERVPFTTKQDVRDSLLEQPPLGLHVAAAADEIAQIQSSSGTTGMPTYVAATRSDLDVWNRMGARVFYANGFRPGDWVLHAYAMSRGFVGGLVNVQHLQHLGCAEIPLGAESGTERLLNAIRHLRPAAMCATPSMTTWLGESAESVLGTPARELSVRKISVGGEPGGGIPSIRERMEELWGADVRDMMGGADFGSTYWAECEEKDGMHLCCQGAIHVELVDPGTGESLPVEEGVEGELVYTALDRRASPLLRYRMGDVVRVTATGCSCGRTSYKIKVRGRADDMLIVRGVNVYPAAIKDVVMQFLPRTTGLLKVVVDFSSHATDQPLKLRVEHAAGLSAAELATLRSELEGRIRDVLTVRTSITLVPERSIEPPGDRKEALIERVGG